MVFDIEQIDDKGFSFKFQVNKDQFLLDQDDCSLNKDVEVDGRLTRVGCDVYLKGKVNTELILNCSRCLDPLAHIVEGNLIARFVPLDHDPALGGKIELHTSDIDTEIYEDHRIDLTQSVLDGILLTVPVVCLCRNDCRGMCPQCGNKLNQGSCKCTIESLTDPRLEVLKKLKDKLE